MKAAKELMEHRALLVLLESRDPKAPRGPQMGLRDHVDRVVRRVPQDRQEQLDLLVLPVQQAL